MRSDLPVTFDSGIGLVPEVMSMCQVHVITRTYPYWNTTLRQSVIEALKRLLVVVVPCGRIAATPHQPGFCFCLEHAVEIQLF